ncbi:MAG: PqqD family protein [Polyangiaceae bacterium]|nr:PqqD family protein [Polyangiaceae bacterium]
MPLAAARTTLSRRDGDTLLILDRASGDYLSVSGAGVRMWELLLSGADRDASIDALLAELDVDRETLAADLDAFTAELLARGLVVEAAR